MLLTLFILSSVQMNIAQVNNNSNHISIENSLPGTTDWQLTNPATNREIEGYASATSVTKNDTIQFFVNTNAQKYSIDIFRMGWYNGLGGRLLKDGIYLNGIKQEIPALDPKTGIVECNWRNPYNLKIDSDWTTGIYLAKLKEFTNSKESYIIFVVRDDTLKSDITFQLPVTTYQAYNFWGGKSLYNFSSGNSLPWGTSEGKRASKVSFDRPYARSPNLKASYGMGAGEFFTNVQPSDEKTYPISSAGWDYNMVRWLEKKGYAVNYVTNIDIHKSNKLLHNSSIFLSNGHDEYWSLNMRNNIIKSRDQGIHLAFFSANTAYWQVRLEPNSTNDSEDRTLVCYKNLGSDPIKNKTATVSFRDPPISEPESGFIGVQYFAYRIDSDITITNNEHPIFKNTSLKNGDKLKGLLGYEVDGVTSFSPSNTIVLSKSKSSYLSPKNMPLKSQIKAFLVNMDMVFTTLVSLCLLIFFWFMTKRFRSKFKKSILFLSTLFTFLILIGLVSLFFFQKKNTSNMTIYTNESGTKVFATGTIQWSWGLDDYNVPELRNSRLNKDAEIITENVFELMGVKNPDK